MWSLITLTRVDGVGCTRSRQHPMLHLIAHDVQMCDWSVRVTFYFFSSPTSISSAEEFEECRRLFCITWEINKCTKKRTQELQRGLLQTPWSVGDPLHYGINSSILHLYDICHWMAVWHVTKRGFLLRCFPKGSFLLKSGMCLVSYDQTTLHV